MKDTDWAEGLAHEQLEEQTEQHMDGATQAAVATEDAQRAIEAAKAGK